jgi:multidrug transporter EmrE-like cation transporter
VNYKFYAIISVCIIFEIIGDYLFKKWTMTNKTWELIVGTTGYIISSLLWLYSLKYEDLSKASVIFIVLSLVALTLIGVYCFDETLTTLNWIGVVLATIAIILVSV